MTALFATTGASGDPVGTADVSAAAGTLTIEAHGLVDGEQVVTASPTGGADALVTGAPYFVDLVDADTFRLRYAPGSPTMTFEADGTVEVDQAAAVYTARAARQALGGLLYKGRGSTLVGRLGARAGVLANSNTNELTISGFTVTVNATNIVINPTAGGTDSGPYVCALTGGSLTVAAADNTNPRRDIVVARVRDHAEDNTGMIEADAYLIAGTPSAIPVAPVAPDGEVLMGVVDVPAAGGGAPTLTYAPDYTVAAGGILPVATVDALPSNVRREGAYADVASTDALYRVSGSAWQAVASITNHSYVTWMTDGGQAVGFNIYTPTITGVGTATFSTQTGRWKRIAPFTILFIAYFVVSSAGSGSSNVIVHAPTDINRATRQRVGVSIEGAAGGGGGNRDGHVVSFTGTTGSGWDRLRFPDGTDSHLDNMVGSHLNSGMSITIQGVYQEEDGA